MATTPRRTPPVSVGSNRAEAAPATPPPFAEQREGGTMVEEVHPIDELLAEAASAAVEVAAPTEHPPVIAIEAEVAEAVGAWLADKRVNALWSNNQNRNIYMGVVGIGWKKLANNSDTAVMALNILAAHARATQCRLDYREEADGMVRECYVW